MAMYQAVYKNAQGGTFSAPVEKLSDGTWVMHTSDGLQLPIHLTFNDDHAGPLIFSHYREEPEPEDLRLHVEPRQPGQSSFRQLQEARAAHINQERKMREEARARAQQTVVNPAKAQAAKDLNAQILRERRPHRGKGE